MKTTRYEGPPLRAQSAINAAVTTITRTITVAAGCSPPVIGRADLAGPVRAGGFGAGGDRARERRLRDLPSRAGIYFVLALGLFPGVGYGKVWQKLTAALDGLPGVPSPTVKALRDLPAPAGPGAAEGAVRGAGRAGGAAVHAGGAVRPGPDGGVRRLHVGQGARQQAEPGLAGEDEGGARGDGLPGGRADDPGGDRTRALIGAVFGPPAPARPITPASCCTCSPGTCWC